MQNGLAQFDRAFYAIPPMKIVAPPVPKDLAEQDKIRLSGAAAVREHSCVVFVLALCTSLSCRGGMMIC